MPGTLLTRMLNQLGEGQRLETLHRVIRIVQLVYASVPSNRRIGGDQKHHLYQSSSGLPTHGRIVPFKTFSHMR